jgi:hypothetical protein
MMLRWVGLQQGAERAEELEVVNRHAIARVALFVANQLNPLLKYGKP